jgi:hypothetical protein
MCTLDNVKPEGTLLKASGGQVLSLVWTWGYNNGLNAPLLGGSQVSNARPGAPFGYLRHCELGLRVGPHNGRRPGFG